MGQWSVLGTIQIPQLHALKIYYLIHLFLQGKAFIAGPNAIALLKGTPISPSTLVDLEMSGLQSSNHASLSKSPLYQWVLHRKP